MRKKEQKRINHPFVGLTEMTVRALSVLLACVLLAGTVQIYARAENTPEEEEEYESEEVEENEDETVKKEEVVYGSMSLSGEVKNLYVVNTFTFPYDSKMKDCGNYSSVENLTDLAPLKDEDGVISAEVKKGRFYYQGELKKKDFPWDIDISYTLNGREKDPELIGGSSGRVGIRIRTSENPDVDPVFYEKYVLVVSVTLDTDICDRIKAKGAMVTSAGSDKMLNFIAMPEKESEFKVRFRTDNFAMKGITFAAMPASLDKEMFEPENISEMTEGLTKLSDGIAALSGGADSLSGGLREFSGGANQLSDGLTALHGGIGQLSDGAGQLCDGAARLREGSSQFKAGLDQLNAGSDELAAGSAQINNVFQSLKKMADMAGGIDTEALIRLRDELMALTGGISKVMGEFCDLAEKIRGSLNFSGFQPVSDAESAMALSELTKLAAEGKISQSTLNVYTRLLGNYIIAVSARKFVNAGGEIRQRIDGLIGALDEKTGDLRDVGIVQPETLLNISGMIGTFADQFQTFHNGIVQYTGGVKALAQNYTQIDQGIQGLAEGATGISGGLKETESGSRRVMEGVSGFADGAGRLAAGMSDLAGGMRELKGQTSDLPGKVHKGIDDMLEKYSDPDFRPPSFTSPKNGVIEAVQFVAATEEIEGAIEDKAEEKEPEKKSFLEKFIDLFRRKNE